MPCASKGVLQDSHWSGGSIGYFPTYALGSAIAAQIFEYLKVELNIERLLREGKMDVVCEWLKENIHQHGGTKQTQEILMDSVKETFNPNYYVEYLLNKYDI